MRQIGNLAEGKPLLFLGVMNEVEPLSDDVQSRSNRYCGLFNRNYVISRAVIFSL